MKKLLALLLSVIMAASLAVPAFASPGPEAGSLGIIGGADGPTAIITSGSADGMLKSGDELKTALGGVAGQIGVMVNGAYVKFPDAAPEISSSRTMIPVRALVETLGGEVDYQDGTVKFVLDGCAYEFAIGSDTVSVRPAAGSGKDTPEPEDIKMDCAPYIKDGRTYVPIRFISEALGYEVGWDSDCQTAILVDREALAAGIDKNFTILNKVQAAKALTLKEGQSGKADIEGKLELTVASLDGNKTYSADFGVTGLVNAQAVSGSATLNVSDALVEQLIAQTGMDEDNSELAQAILGALKKFEFIMNKDGMMWVRSDGLDSITGQKGAWYSSSAGKDAGVDMSVLFAGAGADASSVGKILAAMAGTDSVANWAMVKQTLALMGLYSDDKFTTTGGISTLTIGIDDLMGLYKDMGLSEADMETAKDAFKEYQITMKVDGKGGASAKCVVETNAASGVPGIQMTMDADQSGEKGVVTMDITAAGMGQLKLTLTSTQKAVSEKPATEPPTGATVIDADSPAVLPELNGSNTAK